MIGALLSHAWVSLRGGGVKQNRYHILSSFPAWSSPLPCCNGRVYSQGRGIHYPCGIWEEGEGIEYIGGIPGIRKPRGLSDTRGSFVIYLPNSILTYITPPYYDNFDISLQLPSFPSGSISTLTAQRTVSSEQRLPCVHACLLSGNRLSGHGDIQSI